MGTYILRRLVSMIPVLFGVVTLVFFMLHFAPGDPAQTILGESATAAALSEKRQQMGLNVARSYCLGFDHLVVWFANQFIACPDRRVNRRRVNVQGSGYYPLGENNPDSHFYPARPLDRIRHRLCVYGGRILDVPKVEATQD